MHTEKRWRNIRIQDPHFADQVPGKIIVGDIFYHPSERLSVLPAIHHAASSKWLIQFGQVNYRYF